MSTSTEDRTVVCVACGREIEACYCCENAECGAAICARDVILRTGESIAQPHTHGG